MASWLRPGPTLAEDQPAGRTAASTAGRGALRASAAVVCSSGEGKRDRQDGEGFGMSHPILGTVPQLTGAINWVQSRPVNLCNVCPALSSDTGGEEVAGTSTEAPLPPVMHPTEDFSLEQSRGDTLCSAYDQVIDIDGLLVHPEAARTYTHFQLRNDRLYRVSLDTRTNEICTQLLVPLGNIFQPAYSNPMAGHLGCKKTLQRIMA